MSTRSPHRVNQLCFLLRREPTVRTIGNLERRHTLSLSLKLTNPSHCHFWSSFCTFSPFGEDDNYLAFCLFLIKLSNNLIYVLKSWIFDTWHNLSHPSHPLSTHATCVTWVHVVGEFCHITCLSNLFYGTRHPVHRKMLNSNYLGI